MQSSKNLRIITLSPAATDTVFALGAGGKPCRMRIAAPSKRPCLCRIGKKRERQRNPIWIK